MLPPVGTRQGRERNPASKALSNPVFQKCNAIPGAWSRKDLLFETRLLWDSENKEQ